MFVHRGHTLRILLGTALALTLTLACGGGDDEAQPMPASLEATDEASPDADSVTVDESFWHAGWKVTLDEATLTPGDFGAAEVAISATFENLGDDEAIFDSQLLLTSGGNDYADEGSAGHDLPRVPGEREGEGAFSFRVDEEFSLDDATLVVGNPDNNQAIVPIGPGGDDLVSLEPTEIAASGTATAGAVTLTVERAELRADLPDRHSEVEDGKLALTVYFSATPQAGIQVGQGVLQSPNVVLELPNGTTVAVISDGVSGVNELLQGKEGTTIPDLRVRYEVPEDAEGTYSLILRGKYGAGGADADGKLSFLVSSPSPTR
ncbi:MAG: hypothetical protein ACRDFT_01560 [bacterium]